MEYKELQKYRAKARRLANKDKSIHHIENALEVIAKDLGGSVEVVTHPSMYDRFYQNIIFEYISLGDTYDKTVGYRVDTNQFVVTDLGTEVEMIERKYHSPCD